MVNVGIVGCGAVVQRMYFPALANTTGLKVRWVTDLDRDRAGDVARMFGAEAVSLAELTTRADRIVVTTPPASHRQLVDDCLGRATVVLCEKPFTTTVADARTLVERAMSAGTRLCVGHFRRLFPQLQLARKLVAMGLIGEVTGIAASEGGRFTWRAESAYTIRERAGGVLWDTGSHTLDMALFGSGLSSSMVESVDALVVERDVAEPSHDFYASGGFTVRGRDMRLQLHVSRISALPNLVRITGDRGEIAFGVELDTRVRLSTTRGTTVVTARADYRWPPQYFALQCRKILVRGEDEEFCASDFVTQIALLEALAAA